jgi:alcohol dehydrogenase (NADP+)
LGAKVVVFSHSPNKKDDALKLGADEFVATGEEGFSKKYFDKIDYMLSAADAANLPLSDLLSTLKIDGRMTSVGLPDGPWEGLQPQIMQSNSSAIGCSHIGSKKEA